MDIIQAIILGIVQGLTEFLPISSSAHLGITSKLFNWQEGSITFDVLLHSASLIALIIYFRKDLLDIIKGFRSKDENKRALSFRFVRNIFFSLLPLIPFYLFFNDLIDSMQAFSTISLVLLIVFGIVLIIAERVGQKNYKGMEDITKLKAFCIGIAQSLSLLSGVSRSGITISAGLLLKVKEDEAKKYAFLLAIPTISGAFVLELLSLINNKVYFEFSISVLFGLLASFLSALLALYILFKLGNKIKLSHYGIYRIILGIILLIIL